MKGNNEMNYHTFELCYELTPFENRYYKNILYKSKGRTYLDKNEYVPTIICETLRSYGIIIKIQKFKKNAYDYYMMYYRINPRRVMEQNNYIGLFHEKDTDIMLEKVNGYLKTIHQSMPSADQCRINRIDFCTNITMSGQEEIFEYIKVLQRGFYLKNYAPELFYDAISKRSKFTKNACNIVKKKTVKITYYNKYDQLQENKWCRNIGDAKNILRAEIQCEKQKIRHLMNKFGYADTRSFLKHSDKIGTYVFLYYANKFCGSGDFYKIDEIYKEIERSSFKKKTKKLMKEFVQCSAKHSSADKAIRKLCWSNKNVLSIIKKFNKIGVSPVVIPLKSKYDSFKNPLTLALDA